MIDSFGKLGEIISEVESINSVGLSRLEERFFRMLKTHGERAIKGRSVSKCFFEAREKNGNVLMMVMEGRHSVSVGKQVVNRFKDRDELEFADAVRTRNGACVFLRVKESV